MRSVAVELRAILSTAPSERVNEFIGTVLLICGTVEDAPDKTPRERKDALRTLNEAVTILFGALDKCAWALEGSRNEAAAAAGALAQKIYAAGGPQAFCSRLAEQERASRERQAQLEAGAAILPKELASFGARAQMAAFGARRSQDEQLDMLAALQALLAGGPEEYARRLHEHPVIKTETEVLMLRVAVDAAELKMCLDTHLTSLKSSRGGRPAADENHALTEIARAYRRIFGKKPTAYSSGEFYRVAQVLTGLNDPARQVRAAISRTKPPA